MRGERSVYGSTREKRKTFRLSQICRLCRPGGIGGELPPDPIPNSVVKVPSADGTTS